MWNSIVSVPDRCLFIYLSLRGDFLLLTKFILRNSSTYDAYLIHEKGAKTTEDRVDLDTVEV